MLVHLIPVGLVILGSRNLRRAVVGLDGQGKVSSKCRAFLRHLPMQS